MTDHVFEIRQVKPADEAFIATLSLASGQSRPTEITADAWIADLLKKRDIEPLGQGLVFGAFRGPMLFAAAAAIESHGHSALVFFGSADQTQLAKSAASECLLALRETAKTTTIKILQVLIDADDNQSGELLQLAGFKHLTKLVYFIKNTQNAMNYASPPTDFTWLTYSNNNSQLFCDALDASYVGSFDCPELTGLRVTDDVLLGHRPREGFDPSLWQVAMRDDCPIGVLLLNPLAPQRALEIVYIGVSPEARGRGVSDALMARALAQSKRRALDFITLAVDARNEPAMKLYTRWQFEHCLERDAWLAVR